MANTRDGKTLVSETKIDFGGIIGFGYTVTIFFFQVRDYVFVLVMHKMQNV